MRRTLGLLVLILAAMPVSAQPTDPSSRFMNAPTTHMIAALRRWHMTGPDAEQETSLTFFRVDGPAGTPTRWVAMETDLQGTYHRWADARVCSGLADRLAILDASLDALAPTITRAARLDRDTGYGLTFFRRNWAGSVQYSAQRRVPPTRLETWSEGIIRLLRRCWTSEVPTS